MRLHLDVSAKTYVSILFIAINVYFKNLSFKRLRVDELKAEFCNGNYMGTFRQIQSYSHCFPYMDTEFLIHSLGDVWELFCEKNEIVKKQTNNKISILKADTKANPDTLKATMAALDKAIGKVNVGLYN